MGLNEVRFVAWNGVAGPGFVLNTRYPHFASLLTRHRCCPRIGYFGAERDELGIRIDASILQSRTLTGACVMVC